MRIFSLHSFSAFSLVLSLLCADLTHADHHLTNPHMAKELGTWDAESKYWTSPDAESMVSKAVETNTLLGDHWILSTFKSNLGGMPFEGHGQYGYDPTGKKYVGTWVDTMSPYLSVMEGTLDESTGVLTMMSTGRDPHSHQISTTKLVSSFSDNDHKKFEMFAPVVGEKGKWWKMMEINYTRRK